MNVKRVAVLAVAGIALAACGGVGTERQQSADTATSAAGSPPAVAEPSAEDTGSDTAKVGADEWFTWDDGIEAQVTKLAREGSLGEYSIVDLPPNTPRVVATVTIKNGTGDLFDATGVTVNLYAGPNGATAEKVWQEDGFTGSVPRGKSATARYDFAVPANLLAELRVEVTPSFEHEAAFFEGGIKA